MFLLPKDKEIDVLTLGKILMKASTNERPKLEKWWNYFTGKQAITLRQPSDTGKPCNRIVVNYCNNITENYLGYLSGIPIQYTAEQFEKLLDILNYNDVENEDAEFLRQALIFGRAYEIVYIDAYGKQRFRVLDSRECIPVYDTTLDQELLAVIRYWKEELADKDSPTYMVEVYTADTVTRYRCQSGFSGFQFLEQVPHFFGQVPITVFSLNRDEESIFGQILSLQDAYNSLLSDEVDDFDAFADAYLLLKGAYFEDADLQDMKRKRCIMMDTDGDARYLTKSISDTQIQNMLQNVNDQIHKISACPDFNDEKFMAQSGIAMRYKLTSFENRASAIESAMRKALVKRIELLSAIEGLKTDEAWSDVRITFTRNLPENIADIVTTVNGLRGLVSDETLLGLLPMVDDVAEELRKVEAERQKNMSLIDTTIRYSEEGADDGSGLLEEQGTAGA